MRFASVFLAVAAGSIGSASCNRAPEEPTPVSSERVRPPNGTMPSTVASSVSSSSSSSAPAIACPTDPEPAKVKMFDHGSAAFVTPDGKRHVFRMEIARTEDAQARGLMYRKELADDAGMVFDFATPHQARFWMHDTCIPLDMVFVSEKKVVIGVITAPPLSDVSRAVPGVSKWVVELAAGVAKQRGIAIGTTFEPPS